MGVFKRPESPYYWVYLERRGLRGIREKTMIPCRHNNPHMTKELRRQAEEYYLQRMSELAAADALDRQRARLPLVTKQATPQTNSPSGWCYVYFIQDGTRVKIGRTANLVNRLRNLQTANSSPLTLIAHFPAHQIIEEAIHRHFKHLHQQGEWFHLTPELATFAERVNAGMNPIALMWDTRQEHEASA